MGAHIEPIHLGKARELQDDEILRFLEQRLRINQLRNKNFKRINIPSTNLVTHWQEICAILGDKYLPRLREIAQSIGINTNNLTKRQICYELSVSFDQYRTRTRTKSSCKNEVSFVTQDSIEDLSPNQYYQDDSGYCYTKEDLEYLQKNPINPFTRVPINFDPSDRLKGLQDNPLYRVHEPTIRTTKQVRNPLSSLKDLIISQGTNYLNYAMLDNLDYQRIRGIFTDLGHSERTSSLNHSSSQEQILRAILADIQSGVQRYGPVFASNFYVYFTEPV
jgi:hypothetical protein